MDCVLGEQLGLPRVLLDAAGLLAMPSMERRGERGQRKGRCGTEAQCHEQELQKSCRHGHNETHAQDITSCAHVPQDKQDARGTRLHTGKTSPQIQLRQDMCTHPTLCWGGVRLPPQCTIELQCDSKMADDVISAVHVRMSYSMICFDWF